MAGEARPIGGSRLVVGVLEPRVGAGRQQRVDHVARVALGGVVERAIALRSRRNVDVHALRDQDAHRREICERGGRVQRRLTESARRIQPAAARGEDVGAALGQRLKPSTSSIAASSHASDSPLTSMRNLATGRRVRRP